MDKESKSTSDLGRVLFHAFYDAVGAPRAWSGFSTQADVAWGAAADAAVRAPHADGERDVYEVFREAAMKASHLAGVELWEDCQPEFKKAWCDAVRAVRDAEPVDADCFETFEQVEAKLVAVEAALAKEVGITYAGRYLIRSELTQMARRGALEDTELALQWHELYSRYADSEPQRYADRRDRRDRPADWVTPLIMSVGFGLVAVALRYGIDTRDGSFWAGASMVIAMNGLTNWLSARKAGKP